MHLILVLQACQCSPARAPKCCNTFLVLKVSSNWRHLAKLWHLRQIELTAFALKFFAKVAACVLRAVVLLDLLGCVWMVLLCGMGYYAWYHEPWVRFGWSEERGRYWLIYNDMYIYMCVCTLLITCSLNIDLAGECGVILGPHSTKLPQSWILGLINPAYLHQRIATG